MKRYANAGRPRRLMSAALGAILAVATTVATLVVASPAQAAPAAGWYMLVNDHYDGNSGHDGGFMYCLSTNAQTPAGGSGTHMVYLARCNTSAPAQWWYFPGGSRVRFTNWQRFDGKAWDLSSNRTTPPGGGAGTYSAFTAPVSAADGHYWNVWEGSGVNRHVFWSHLSGQDLSASHNNPYPGGTYRVFTAGSPAANVPPAHFWRFWQPTTPPVCSTCGG